jgi:Tol biopolymer transport system component
MLSPGTQVDAYEILGPIGRGGMGEVYKAKDTRVDRFVAVKVLPAEVAGERDAQGRFEREARSLAALSHPRICSLYEFTRHEDRAVLVMEYLEGQSVAERLAAGRLQPRDALPIAIEVADGLAAAHRAGLVHRDLKPGNIMLTRAGAKLLDFGLAKENTRAPGGDDPTLAAGRSGLTEAGVAVGTLAYMAPEQLAGQAVDARTDIWAFGCLLFEMLTGRRAFAEVSLTDLRAAILEAEPSLSPTRFTAALERVIRKCLARDPDSRWQSAVDLRDELAWINSDTGSPAAPVKPRRLWPAIALWAGVLMAIAAAFFLGSRRTGTTAAPPTRHFELTVPRTGGLAAQGLSPDGSSLAFIGPGPDGTSVLWLRSLASPNAQILADTEGAEPSCPPFWSPDGRSIAFVARGKLRRIDAAGGHAQPVADVNGTLYGGDWNADGTIVVGTYQLSKTHGVHRVSAAGGSLAPFVALESNALLQAVPRFLPDGRRFLFLSWLPEVSRRDICVASLDDPAARCLGLHPDFFAGVTGSALVFMRGDTLYAHPFDSGTATLRGTPVVIAERLARDGFGRASVSVAGGGLLLYEAARPELRQLVWIGRDGARLGTLGDVSAQTGVEMSGDGQWVAVVRSAEQGPAAWLFDVRRGVTTRIAGPNGDVVGALVSADGARLTYITRINGRAAIVERPSQGGEGRALFDYAGEGILALSDRSRDGQHLVIGLAERDRRILQVLTIGGEPATIAQGSVSLTRARLSPDGRWLAYESAQTGEPQLFISQVSGGTQQRQVSAVGGFQPEWRADGRELFFIAPDGKLMVTSVDPAKGMDLGTPRVLFPTELRGQLVDRRYGVTADGKRFLFAVPRAGDTAAGTTTFQVLVNWTDTLMR